MKCMCKHKLRLQLKTAEKGQLALADNINAEVVRQRITHQGELFFGAEYRLNASLLMVLMKDWLLACLVISIVDCLFGVLSWSSG